MRSPVFFTLHLSTADCPTTAVTFLGDTSSNVGRGGKVFGGCCDNNIAMSFGLLFFTLVNIVTFVFDDSGSTTVNKKKKEKRKLITFQKLLSK